MTNSNTYDYIIAGGGLSGCVVASRLKQAFPSRAVAVVESGPESRDKPILREGSKTFEIPPEYFHHFESEPQKSCGGRRFPMRTGRALGGGSAVNYGSYTRGHRDGYDEWAKLVGDERWSYDGLLPFFRRAENYGYTAKGLDAQHGYDGPIVPSLGEDRGYLLRADAREALLSSGVPFNDDANGGDSIGVSGLVESWYKNERSFSATKYDLSGVDILTESQVVKISTEKGRATGVVLKDGRALAAKIEVIVSCGALYTPQILMLSGIGPREELAKFNIPLVVDSPGVGRNLHDHFCNARYYKLLHPELGLAIGNELFMSRPKHFEGHPCDWMIVSGLTDAELDAAAKIDGDTRRPRRDEIEITWMYLATPTSTMPPPANDGTIVSLNSISMNTTSRGSVSLRSADPSDQPIVDPNYLGTEHDRAVARAGARLTAKVMDSVAGRRIAIGEVPQGGHPPLTVDSTDEEIDAHTRDQIITCFHTAGTAAMGDVVDSECRVKGIEGLRVVDTSIMPVSIGAHLQVPSYGVSEQAAQMIIDATK